MYVLPSLPRNPVDQYRAWGQNPGVKIRTRAWGVISTPLRRVPSAWSARRGRDARRAAEQNPVSDFGRIARARARWLTRFDRAEYAHTCWSGFAGRRQSKVAR